MPTYITALELWKSLGKNSYTKVRSETVGTGNASTTSWSLDKDNVISGSDTIYTAGTIDNTYTLDLDDGEITTLTASSGDAITADYFYADIPDSQIQEVLKRADEFLTDSTGRTFATSSTTEYFDVDDSTKDEYFLGQWPMSTISSLEINNSSSPTDTPSWKTLTQGLGNDFITNGQDLSIGRFRFIDNFPTIGKDRIKVTYTHGYASTPNRVKELATLLAQRQMINSTVYQTIFKGQDFSPARLDEVNARIEELTRQLKKIDIEKP